MESGVCHEYVRDLYNIKAKRLEMDASNMLEALKLLVVGMGTVFVVLIIIIEGGKLLIKAVNRIAPEEESKPAAEPSVSVSPAVAKAIERAVQEVTGGEGQVIEIKRL